MQIPPYTIFTFDTIDSTNRHLKENSTQYEDYAVIWAKEQTSGRGRFDRSWSASSGDDLTFSIYMPLKEIPQRNWPNITQVMALTLHETLLEHNIKTEIKWPNDLLIEGKKLCGILCELIQNNGTSMAILGVGLNVNSSITQLENINRPAISLFSHTTKQFDLKMLISYILERFYSNLKFLQDNDFEQLRSKIWQNLTFRGQHIIIVDGEKTHAGLIEGLNMDGTLQFLCDSCGSISLNSGEISFRN
ncbi:MAG: biotin--[acetyl-CoA-carboxylase] ligase [Colwellia sp.]